MLEDAPDLSGLDLAREDMEEHGALCAEVDGAEELGAFSEEPLSLEVLSESHLAPGCGEACDDAYVNDGV